MQTKILKDRPTRGGAKEKLGGGLPPPLPQSGYGPALNVKHFKKF